MAIDNPQTTTIYEYKPVVLTTVNAAHALNEHGLHGWRVVHVWPTETLAINVLLERKVVTSDNG